MIRDAMMYHLYSKNVIAHGFATWICPEEVYIVTKLLETVRNKEGISNGIDKGFHVLVVFLEFAKTFDRVCHASLRAKLIACGFFCFDWISDFLSRRQQRVVMGQ